MDQLTDREVTILLNALDFQLSEIQRRQDREQQIFQWSTSVLLAVFGVVTALYGTTATTSFPNTIKFLASLMVILPIVASIYWIFRLSSQAVNNARTVERLQELLFLFHTGYYGAISPYPQSWRGNLAHNLRHRRTPVYYGLILATMMICVVLSVWIVL